MESGESGGKGFSHLILSMGEAARYRGCNAQGQVVQHRFALVEDEMGAAMAVRRLCPWSRMGLLDSIDNGLAGLMGQWNAYSTGLMTALVVVVGYHMVTSREPDVHPLLLVRQSVASTVRNEGESAVYRSQAAPHGMPLNTGLNVKDAGAARWSRGRDGDLRDIWRKAVAGGEKGVKGRIMTVLGAEKVVEHALDDVTRQIKAVGRHIADRGGIKVAIFLPNSVELVAALMACSFYPNLTAVLMPFEVSEEELISMVKRSAVDTLVASPGTFSLDAVVKAHPSLRQVIWVVDEGNSHMDWSDGVGGSVDVATWKDLVAKEAPLVGSEVPAPDPDRGPQDVVTFWQGDMVRFTQANLVSGIAGQLAAIPTRDRMGPWDVFVPVDALTNIHTLVLTLAALYSNASIALNSVAGRAAGLVQATQGVEPTIIVAGPETLLTLHKESAAASGLGRLSRAMSTQTLAGRGVFAPSNFLSAFSPAPAVGSKLRLVYAAERAGTGMPRLSSTVLSDLRIMTGARVVYALSAARVAGAVSQTALFDYRIVEGSHFGAPPTSVEVLLRDKDGYQTTDSVVEGEIVARGPCVSGNEASTGIVGRMRSDQTLSCI
ncbi:hypothetical protein CDD80_7388 [Ophiocordyceps camponoti-rufipedis]|uniref:AMP-dependent synthetase/ligase domain-containing protein n=1 Tax=Ophiocordyceps camponoti-rufipedis TaxID=2004952 RepID=A0A2C5Z8A9_9HYPO|nr:hypothetical protein CDD80_7388 [Ophiocordyceps camponoti-rufipedis]